MRLTRLIALLTAASLLLAGCGGATKTPGAGSAPAPAAAPQDSHKQPEPLIPLKIGYLNVMDDAQAMLAKDAGFYEKHGLDVELHLFNSGTDLIKAIVGGQLQAGVLGFTNAVTWAEKGADLKVIGGAQMGYHSILVNRESGIKRVADLKGKKLASQGKGSTADIVLNGVVLPQAGLKKEDVTVVYTSPANAIQALAAGQVDAAFVFEPYEQLAVTTSDVISIYEIGKVWPFPCMVVIASGKFLTENRAAADRLLDAQEDAIQMMQQNPRGAAELLVKRFIAEESLKTPAGASVPAVDVVQRAIETQMFHSHISPEEIDRMNEAIVIMVGQGILEKAFDVKTILDLTWQQKAGKSH